MASTKEPELKSADSPVEQKPDTSADVSATNSPLNKQGEASLSGEPSVDTSGVKTPDENLSTGPSNENGQHTSPENKKSKSPKVKKKSIKSAKSKQAPEKTDTADLDDSAHPSTPRPTRRPAKSAKKSIAKRAAKSPDVRGSKSDEPQRKTSTPERHEQKGQKKKSPKSTRPTPDTLTEDDGTVDSVRATVGEATPRSADSVILTEKTPRLPTADAPLAGSSKHGSRVETAASAASSEAGEGAASASEAGGGTAERTRPVFNIVQAALRGEWNIVDQYLRHSERHKLQATTAAVDEVGKSFAFLL